MRGAEGERRTQYPDIQAILEMALNREHKEDEMGDEVGGDCSLWERKKGDQEKGPEAQQEDPATPAVFSCKKRDLDVY